VFVAEHIDSRVGICFPQRLHRRQGENKIANRATADYEDPIYDHSISFSTLDKERRFSTAGAIVNRHF
jgi:hypothetical protein